jgi:hypothetical protein
MRLKTLVIALLVTLPIPTAAALANRDKSPKLDAAKAASTPYRKVAVATAAGYKKLLDEKGIACIDNPGVGTMGIHFVNGKFVGDTKLNVKTPEALVYEPKAHGKLQLAALEYIVFQAAWDAKHSMPPSLFGQQFALTTKPNRFGLDPFYSLHAWVWKNNPAGTLEPWNPKAHC